MHERRQFIRWKVDRQADIKVETESACALCQLKDISYKGAQLSCSQRLPRDKFLKLQLNLSQDCSFEVEAWVAWHKSIDGINLYGLYFSRIRDADKEKIYKFIRSFYPQEINKQWWRGLNAEKGGEEMEDRRIFDRFQAECPLRFLDRSANREGLAKTVDISAKGIGIESSQELTVRTPLEMWLNMPDRSEPLYTRGEIIWSKLVKPNLYRAGINLEKADFIGFSRLLRLA